MDKSLWEYKYGPRVVNCNNKPSSGYNHPEGQDGIFFRVLYGSDHYKYLWAGGKIESADAQWYDFTDAGIRADELQFGIGKDSIRAIDDPLFVSPDDPRLLELGASHYRREKRPETTGEIKVIGYVEGDQARAYPVALLDSHELVNDRIGGKPITVGW